MKENMSLYLKLFLKLIGATLMSFVIAISVSVIFSATTENIGYIAYGNKSGEEAKELYTHYFADGEDLKQKEFENQGYIVRKMNFRSEVSKTNQTINLIITQFLSFGILYLMLHSTLWDMGARDSNLVKFKHKEKDILKGLKIGSIIMIPSILMLLCLVIGCNSFFQNFPTVLYKFLNSYNYSLIEVIVGDCASFGELSAIKFILLFVINIIIPAMCFISYYLGFKNISVMEKVVYK